MATKIIYGIENVSDFMGANGSVDSRHTIVHLLQDLRRKFDFPMVRRRDPVQETSVPSLDLKEFKVWCKEHEVNPSKPEDLTLEALERGHIKRAIENASDRTLKGMGEICKFSGLDVWWFHEKKNYVDYPVRKVARGAEEVGTRELLRFLFKHGAPLPLHEIFRKRRPAA